MTSTTKTVLIVLAVLAGLGCMCLGAAAVFLAPNVENLGAPANVDPSGEVEGVKRELLGQWMRGSISGPALHDAITGDFVAYAGGSGMNLEFRADGTVTQVGMIESRGACTLRMGTVRDGTWRVEGDVIIVEYTDGSGASTSSCSSESRRLTPKLETVRYRYRIEQTDGVHRTLELDFDGQHESLAFQR